MTMIRKACREFTALTHSKDLIPGVFIVIVFFLTSYALFPRNSIKTSGDTISTGKLLLPTKAPTPTPTHTKSLHNDTPHNNSDSHLSIISPRTVPANASSSSAVLSSEDTNHSLSSQKASQAASRIKNMPTITPIPPVTSQPLQNSKTQPTPTVYQTQNDKQTSAGNTVKQSQQQITQTIQELPTVGIAIGKDLTQAGSTSF